MFVCSKTQQLRSCSPRQSMERRTHHLLTGFRRSCLGAQTSALGSHRQLGICPMIFNELLGKDGAEMPPSCSPGPGLDAGAWSSRRGHCRHYHQKQVSVPDTALSWVGSCGIWCFSDGSLTWRRSRETSASDEKSLKTSSPKPVCS